MQFKCIRKMYIYIYIYTHKDGGGPKEEQLKTGLVRYEAQC